MTPGARSDNAGDLGVHHEIEGSPSGDPLALNRLLYDQFQAALAKARPAEAAIPYHWGALPSPLSIRWMAYSWMFAEFSREIANVINSLTRHIRQLRAWSLVVSDLDDSAKLHALIEFIEDPATIALNLPYVIRSRLLFAAAHLSHQANQVRLGAQWRDDLPLDQAIYQEAFDQSCGHWGRQYGRLKHSLERINARDYQAATHDFRNNYNHRFSPNFVIGIQAYVEREVRPDGRIRYGFGEREPFVLGDIVTLLEGQRQASGAAFLCFQNLVRAQEAAITHANAQDLQQP